MYKNIPIFDETASDTAILKISNNLKENQELASLRDWLLPMLMNGQVSVGGYEVEDSELGMVAESEDIYLKEKIQ